jgi:5-methylcytosine-specific restriction endonuclease McrA
MPIEIECDFCGEKVSKSPSEVERAEHHFCDRECYGEWYSERHDSRIVLNCGCCGTEYRRYEASLKQNQTNTFCSKECRGRWQVKNRPQTECTHCGKGIKRIKSELESSEQHFCSQECKWEWQQETATYDWKSTPNYGPLWKERREQVLERDNRTCQACGHTEDDLGYTPRVHHIRPFSEFDEDEIETAHDLSNLVSLCEPCHTRWEGIPLRPKLI